MLVLQECYFCKQKKTQEYRTLTVPSGSTSERKTGNEKIRKFKSTNFGGRQGCRDVNKFAQISRSQKYWAVFGAKMELFLYTAISWMVHYRKLDETVIKSREEKLMRAKRLKFFTMNMKNCSETRNRYPL